MASAISLALVLHNHQPVGNFGWVIEDVYRAAYEPMLGALERHPGVRVGLHYTGPLLEWLEMERPEAVERLHALAARGQVEILGGGYYEPVLASLPERDRHGQLVRMADELERRFGARPIGAWLAERVWEPSLAADLARAGYRYTILDDNHLRAASVPEEEMWGTYTTDDQGELLTIFGSEQGLRYRIPWVPVPEVIAYLRAHATPGGRRIGMMGDDGEKFGAWPETFDYCWGPAGWVDEFFGEIERNADWLSMALPSEWLRRAPPLGRLYIPTSSYVEMTEWSLPPAESRVFHALLEEARREGSSSTRFLRGGFWRNFQARYREVNDLHKQMLRVSAKVAAMPPGADRERALDHLYRGQSNDCYWHGLFGGIYIVHMRMATLGHLIAAEDLADAAGGSAAPGIADMAVRGDFDLDGLDEILLADAGQVVLVDPAEGGGVGTWDLRSSRVALAAALRRRPEAYHEQVAEQERTLAAREAAGAATDRSGPISPHAGFASKERGLAALLVYDPHERRSGLLRLMRPLAGAPDPGPAELAALRYQELGDFTTAAYVVAEAEPRAVKLRREAVWRHDGRQQALEVTKRLTIGGDRLAPTLALDVTARNTGQTQIACELVLEWNLNLMGGGHNPAAYYEWHSDEAAVRRPPHDVPGETAPAREIAFGNSDAGLRVTALASSPARISWFPIETVSNSEAGFERVYQGSSLLFRWPLRLSPGEAANFGVRFTADQSRDLREEERHGKRPVDAVPGEELQLEAAPAGAATPGAVRQVADDG